MGSKNFNLDYVAKYTELKNELKICVINDYLTALEIKEQITQHNLKNCVIYVPITENPHNFESDEIIKVIVNENIFKINDLVPYNYFDFIYCYDFFNVLGDGYDERKNNDIYNFIFSKLKADGHVLINMSKLFCSDHNKNMNYFLFNNAINKSFIENLEMYMGFDTTDAFRKNTISDIFMLCKKNRI